MTNKPTPEELVSLIIEKAPDLRRAGVTELELEGLSVRLAPFVEAPAQVEDSEPEPAPGSFEDPALYGLPPGSPVPGFAALRESRARKSKGDS